MCVAVTGRSAGKATGLIMGALWCVRYWGGVWWSAVWDGYGGQASTVACWLETGEALWVPEEWEGRLGEFIAVVGRKK